jgi:hypothetical protein
MRGATITQRCAIYWRASASRSLKRISFTERRRACCSKSQRDTVAELSEISAGTAFVTRHGLHGNCLWSSKGREQWVCPGGEGRFHREGSVDSSFQVRWRLPALRRAVAATHAGVLWVVLYESGFAPRWYVPQVDIEESPLTPVAGQTFCP